MLTRLCSQADLTFGESLNQLSSSMYSSWVEATFASVKFIIFGRIGREWGLEKLLGRLIPVDVRRKRDNHVRFAAGKVDKRMAEKTERPDIWTYVTRHSEGQGSLTQSELHSNGATFMLAGTETTATALSGMTYMLLKNPTLLDRLTKEVRDAFKSLEDMTMTKLSQLEYMHAVIEEGLRMYPPVANGLPRVTPKDGASVCGHWIPGGVSCDTSKSRSSVLTSRDRLSSKAPFTVQHARPPTS
jgi:cytochrome P450